MARTTSYGMGQYRYNKNYDYIQRLSIPDSDISYYKTNYQDIQVKLPTITNSNSTTPIIQYGETFYVRLTVPQNNQYTTILNLKLCPASLTDGNSIDTSRFQHIKRLIVPPTPENDNDQSNIVLFDANPLQSERNNPNEDIHVQLWTSDYNLSDKSNLDNQFFAAGYLYRTTINSNTGETEDRYCLKNCTGINNFRDSENSIVISLEKDFFIRPQSWKIQTSAGSTVTYDFIFSPKYNLTGGYSYLLIETDRSDAYHQTIQYVDSDDNDKNTYYGTRLNKNQIKIELYHVSNLLQNGASGQSQIQAGTDSLSHIGVWGHPNQMMSINGEEIRIGQSGFYELNDYTINQLGMIVRDQNVDRFTIDYEYKIIKN